MQRVVMTIGAVLFAASSAVAQTCDGKPINVFVGPCAAGMTCQANLGVNGIQDVIAIHPENQGNWVVRISPGDRICGRPDTGTLRVNVRRDILLPPTPAARALAANYVECRAACFGRGTAAGDFFQKIGTSFKVTFKGLAGDDYMLVQQRDAVVDIFDGGDGLDDALLYTDPLVQGGDTITNIEFIE